jgi:NADH-quinone oxidoreductase subunit C
VSEDRDRKADDAADGSPAVRPEGAAAPEAPQAAPDADAEAERARRIAAARAKAAAMAASREGAAPGASAGAPAAGGAAARAAAAPKAGAPAAPPLPPELERLKALVGERFPDLQFDPGENGAVGYVVPRERLVEVCRALRDWPETRCDYLACLSGVDYPEYVEVVYHVTSLETPASFALKARAPKDDCRLPSVTGVWAGANWHEREVFDLLGVTFDGHPDLRRILLPEGFSGGYPLRKDFVDRRPPRERQVRVR